MMKKKYEKPSITFYELEEKNLILLTSDSLFPDFDPDPDPDNPYPYPIG